MPSLFVLARGQNIKIKKWPLNVFEQLQNSEKLKLKWLKRVHCQTALHKLLAAFKLLVKIKNLFNVTCLPFYLTNLEIERERRNEIGLPICIRHAIIAHHCTGDYFTQLKSIRLE